MDAIKKRKIAVIGLGYVGMPLAISFAKKFDVLGYDIDKVKIDKYLNYEDPTGEVGSKILQNTTLKFSSNETDLKEADFYIITVPTPIKQDNTPNLVPIEEATKLIGKYLNKGDIVVYESTVYPGVTEDICVPLLDDTSGLKCIKDYKVGYSPERINPGDKKNTVENIVKIVSGIDNEALNIISEVYGKIINAGIYKASNIKVAESAKVVENSQRDINIAFMNEISQVFDLMEINTFEVIEAMNTKWNALGFYPGLVGGHCIGVDPYYFIYQAENLGYHSQIISSGRKINNSMAKFVTNNLIKELFKLDKNKESKILIVGATFKENTPDLRNSKILKIIEELNEYGITPDVVDPFILENTMNINCNIINCNIIKNNNITEKYDAIVYAVNHDVFKKMEENEFFDLLNNEKAIILDLKDRFSKNIPTHINYWSL
ncbi:nucleotide sugar dehydrogenase [Staphylococcus saprophyticus]|nr:nucleotide sugar dehydrogenase [Staphylococcus saprophyticus]MDW3992549.1 nucleotide sugar dehydrogenase [Staphylococcus saprophyticus]MDW4030003.1 nucleotide sugar dehydrogenase [Staphylococcus saprophyticus]MDW4085059.1 nucleotide sugar dehydrogenase [Staphylococcus saprophyticus]